jgi:hypothetical protein
MRAAERRGLQLHYDGISFAVYLEGAPADAEIRIPEVTALVSAISAMPEVREWVNERLRALARAGMSLVVEGIGTVFPTRACLPDASSHRAARRLSQRGLPPHTTSSSGNRGSHRPRQSRLRRTVALKMAADAFPRRHRPDLRAAGADVELARQRGDVSSSSSAEFQFRVRVPSATSQAAHGPHSSLPAPLELGTTHAPTLRR